MLSLPPSVRIHLCTRPADLRRSFDGLARLVEEYLACSWTAWTWPACGDASVTSG
jgi:hypothetical protein